MILWRMSYSSLYARSLLTVSDPPFVHSLSPRQALVTMSEKKIETSQGDISTL